MTHWYTPFGRAPNTVPYADPSRGERPTTLRDARKHRWAPGVTDILRVMASPALTEWKVKEAIKLTQSLCQVNPSLLAMHPEALVAEVRAQEDTSKRDIGTEIHADIERAIQGKPHGNSGIVDAVLERLNAEFSTVFVAEHQIYSDYPLPYGGTIDLYSKDGIVLDIKTKEQLPDDRNRLQYDEHRMQLAAYGRATEAHTLGNVFVDYTGDVEIILIDEEQIEKALAMFDLCVRLWYQQKGF